MKPQTVYNSTIKLGIWVALGFCWPAVATSCHDSGSSIALESDRSLQWLSQVPNVPGGEYSAVTAAWLEDDAKFDRNRAILAAKGLLLKKVREQTYTPLKIYVTEAISKEGNVIIEPIINELSIVIRDYVEKNSLVVDFVLLRRGFEPYGIWCFIEVSLKFDDFFRCLVSNLKRILPIHEATVQQDFIKLRLLLIDEQSKWFGFPPTKMTGNFPAGARE